MTGINKVKDLPVPGKPKFRSDVSEFELLKKKGQDLKQKFFK